MGLQDTFLNGFKKIQDFCLNLRRWYWIILAEQLILHFDFKTLVFEWVKFPFSSPDNYREVRDCWELEIRVYNSPLAQLVRAVRLRRIGPWLQFPIFILWMHIMYMSLRAKPQASYIRDILMIQKGEYKLIILEEVGTQGIKVLGY